MIGRQDFNGSTQGIVTILGFKIVNRHLDGFDAVLAAEVSIRTGLIIDDGEDELAISQLDRGGGAGTARGATRCRR